jgi:hypothetical protein
MDTHLSEHGLIVFHLIRRISCKPGIDSDIHLLDHSLVIREKTYLFARTYRVIARNIDLPVLIPFEELL